MIQNRNILRGYHYDFIQAKDFTSVAKASATPAIATFTSSAGPEIEQINSTGITGLNMSTAGELVRHLWVPKGGADLSKRVYFRVHWTSASSTGADTVDWKVLTSVLAHNTDRLNSISPATALTFPIPQDTVGASATYSYRVTAPGYVDFPAAGVTMDQAGTYLAVLDCEMDAKAGGLSEDIWLIGLEVAFVPKVSKHASAGSLTGVSPLAWV